MTTYKCSDGDILDQICFVHYNRNWVELGIVEYVLKFNQNLSRQEIHLPVGTEIQLPDISEIPSEALQSYRQQIQVFA